MVRAIWCRQAEFACGGALPGLFLQGQVRVRQGGWKQLVPPLQQRLLLLPLTSWASVWPLWLIGAPNVAGGLSFAAIVLGWAAHAVQVGWALHTVQAPTGPGSAVVFSLTGGHQVARPLEAGHLWKGLQGQASMRMRDPSVAHNSCNRLQCSRVISRSSQTLHMCAYASSPTL